MLADNLVLGTEMMSAEEAQEVMQEVVQNPSIVGDYIKRVTPDVVSFLVHVGICLLVFLIGIKIVKWICRVIEKSMEKGGAEVGVTRFICSLLKYALDFVLIMFILSSFGLSGTIVAVLGSAGLTVGLALQGSLSNFAGGVLIILLKPFKIGDYIIDHGCGKEGTVSEITVFYTKLLTVDNRVIYIPNGTLSNATITNVSKMATRRVDLIVSVAYDTDMAKVKSLLRQLAEDDSRILKNQPIDIYVDELADSSINIGCRVWVNSENYFPVKWDLTEQMKNLFDKEGINIPFPQMDIHVQKNI